MKWRLLYWLAWLNWKIRCSLGFHEWMASYPGDNPWEKRLRHCIHCDRMEEWTCRNGCYGGLWVRFEQE